jgi:hypothetical protein
MGANAGKLSLELNATVPSRPASKSTGDAMQPLDDYPIGSERDTITSPPPGERRGRIWAVAAVCLLIAAAGAAFYLTRRPAEPVAQAERASTPAEQQPAAPRRTQLGPEVEPRDLPPLDLSDPIVRELLGGLSSRPELAAWLATDGLIRNLVASVDNVARGASPSPHLRRLAPDRPFAAQARGGDFVIDARSYRRYDGIADTVAALDADGLARTYSILRPRLQDAYRELGYPDGNFDLPVERAIARLLDTPLLEQDVDVRPSPVLYKFTNERIENLTPAQKQLLRMGPRNARMVQDKLRELAAALGIPPERLSQPTR